MNKKLLFVYNPHSGTGSIKTHLNDVVEAFVSAGYDTMLYPTAKRGDATTIIKSRAKEFDLIVCSGGDGTLNEAVNGVMNSDTNVPLGYIPTGSTNDFASSMGIPGNIKKSAKAIVEGRSINVDIGKMNQKYFVYVAGFGLFTEVAYSTDQELKNIMGHAAYLVSAVKSLGDIKSHQMQIETDGKLIQGDFMLGLITNSTQVGGMKNLIFGDVEFSDGLFEVLLIKTPKNPMELHQIIASLTNPDMDLDMIYSFKSGYLKITSKDSASWTLDGEFGGDHKVVSISNQKQALKIMVSGKKKSKAEE